MSPGLPFAWRLRAAGTAIVVPPLVRLRSLARVAAWLGSPAVAPADRLDDAALARWVDRVLRWLPGPWHYSCLKRAAVLYRLLRRAGRPVELCIGVRRGARRELAAHAWLTRNGTPYLEPDARAVHAHTLIAQFPEPDPPAVVPCVPPGS